MVSKVLAIFSQKKEVKKPWDCWVHILRPDIVVSFRLAADSLRESGILQKTSLSFWDPGVYHHTSKFIVFFEDKTSLFSTSSRAILLLYNLLLPQNQHINTTNSFSLLLIFLPPSLPGTKSWSHLRSICPLNLLYPVSHQVLSICPLKSIPSPRWLLPPSLPPPTPNYCSITSHLDYRAASRLTSLISAFLLPSRLPYILLSA